MIWLQRFFDLWRVTDTCHVERAPVHFDHEGWLQGDSVTLIPSDPSWTYRELSTPDSEPIAIIWHYSATDAGTAKSMARRRTRKYRRGKDRPANWHISIEQDGRVIQQVSCESGGWHCARGRIDGHRVNKCSVGIELIGHGKEFSKAQADAAYDVVSALVENYGITRENCERNHSDFDPDRRSDAGPVWNGEHLPGILDQIFAS